MIFFEIPKPQKGSLVVQLNLMHQEIKKKKHKNLMLGQNFEQTNNQINKCGAT